MKYRLFDFAIEADLPLPELERAGTAAILRIIRDDHPERAAAARPFHAFAPGSGGPWPGLARAGSDLLLTFPDTLTLRYVPPDLRWHAAPGVPDSTIRHILIDDALPRIASQEGRLVLHAACACGARGAIAFAGPTGSGKSTLAASLARGGDLPVADDALAVTTIGGDAIARPAYYGVRLWPDTSQALGYAGGSDVSGVSQKQRFGGAAPAPAAPPLTAIYVLAPAPSASTPAVRQLSAREAVIALLQNSFVLDIEDRDRMAAQFDALSEIAIRVPVRELTVPRTFDRLADLHRLLARELPVGALVS